MTLEWCKKCKTHHFNGCTGKQFLFMVLEKYPSWEWNDDEASEVWAIDPEEAAERGCETEDCESAEYDIVRTGSAEVIIKDEAGKFHTFRIAAESRPHYNAYPKPFEFKIGEKK